jgi:hypothetical protein
MAMEGDLQYVSKNWYHLPPEHTYMSNFLRYTALKTSSYSTLCVLLAVHLSLRIDR